MTQISADVAFAYHGSIVMVTPYTDAAKAWVDENLELEGWQWMGPSFACEPRCADNLADGMAGDGLTVDAWREARRSCDNPTDLEMWNGEKYILVEENLK